ncbi:response regulator [Leptolyngbya sp. NK1-12]|uniref:Response regulator n=1 Tax=Leptolyngbya sp. NK1-12 TaxID=2547451 RepID=A0AA96WBJ1_9CYAN|nr:response regulator [Leptolyngbya sp. NK1-12]
MNVLRSKPVSEASRILVIDDIEDNAFLLQTLLESEGYRVEVASSGPVGLNLIETTPPDLVLLDVMMPEMNGFEVVQRIRQNSTLPSIPILLISGHAEAASAQIAGIRVDGFVSKPIDFEELLSRVRAILQSKPVLS